ncbi:MAG TPA: LD-carboxypeptidase [Spirochaetota bacterium]|nr:LD-carboxypeptidase [Spirochaetota bacterium]HOL57002.1 LD-carboxypeptidase [Spirochaetota bacterium]HPP03842.1 LD-carboxypeptidase [Spirochaetota bacterium]
MKNITLNCIGLIGCSSFDVEKNGEDLAKIKNILQYNLNIKVKIADSLFSIRNNKDKANDLNLFFKDREIDIIFDISGGDAANNILEYIDYTIVKNSKAIYAGYSDNTVIINTLYKKSNKYSYYYNINNLIRSDSLNQIEYFKKIFIDRNFTELFNYKFLKGNKLNGIVIGGNIRCFLKLAGTRYFPNFKNKILFLESYSGNEDRIISYLYQLKHIGVFKGINGIILGTFTELEIQNKDIEDMFLDFFKEYKFPIIKSNELGHNSNAKLIVIGSKINL